MTLLPSEDSIRPVLTMPILHCFLLQSLLILQTKEAFSVVLKFDPSRMPKRVLSTLWFVYGTTKEMKGADITKSVTDSAKEAISKVAGRGR